MRIPVLLIAISLPLAACSAANGTGTPGTGSGTTRSYPLSGFTGVDLRGSDNVDVRVGTGFSVRAEGPAAELDKLRLTRDGDMLRIDRVGSGLSGFSWGDQDSVTVYVTMPRIMAANSAGSGDIKIDRAEGERFTGTIAGSGDLAIAALTASKVDLAIRGSGGMTLKGSVGALDVDIEGSGEVDGAGLKASSAKVTVAGSGDVTAAVTGAATVRVMGSGNVDLGRAAKCSTTMMGSGEVKCG